MVVSQIVSASTRSIERCLNLMKDWTPPLPSGHKRKQMWSLIVQTDISSSRMSVKGSTVCLEILNVLMDIDMMMKLASGYLRQL